MNTEQILPTRQSVFGNEGSVAKLKCHFQEPVIGGFAEEKTVQWGRLPVRSQSECTQLCTVLPHHGLLETVLRILTYHLLVVVVQSVVMD